MELEYELVTCNKTITLICPVLSVVIPSSSSSHLYSLPSTLHHLSLFQHLSSSPSQLSLARLLVLCPSLSPRLLHKSGIRRSNSQHSPTHTHTHTRTDYQSSQQDGLWNLRRIHATNAHKNISSNKNPDNPCIRIQVSRTRSWRWPML